MIGHYTINIPEIFQVFEWLSEFARDALRGGFSKWHVCERENKVLENPFLQNLHRDSSFRTRCDIKSV